MKKLDEIINNIDKNALKIIKSGENQDGYFNVSYGDLAKLYNLFETKNEKLIWYLHPYKTGGTSIFEFFKSKNYKNLHLEYDGHNKFSFEKERELSLSYSNLYKLISLRCPINHTKSMYSYCVRTGGTQWGTSGKSFSKWIRDTDYCKDFYIDWLSDNDLEKAFRVMNKFDYIVDTGELNKQMTDFLTDIGINDSFKLKVNTSNSNFYVSAGDIKVIKEKRKNDFILTNHFNIKSIY